MSSRIAPRALAVATLVAIALALAQPAPAAQKKVEFNPTSDRSSWFWTQQIDQPVPPEELDPVVGAVCDAAAPTGAPCPTQRVRIRSPQAANTLPVAVINGAVDKVSALVFGLADRGVTQGSMVDKFALKIVQTDGAGDVVASFNDDGKQVQACRIDDFWPGGEAEVWETQPPYGGKEQTGEPKVSQPPFAPDACVVGKTSPGTLPTETVWSFDLTKIAEKWGEDPFSNNGVMFVPVLGDGGPTETWQVNLKIPARDDVATPINEFEDTKRFVSADLVFTPGKPEAPTAPPPGGASVSPDGTAAPPTSIEPPPSPSSVAPPDTSGAPVASPPMEPVEMPGFVWLLVPLGLLALAGARSALVDTVAGTKRGGVIESIRERNAQRRGTSLEDVDADPLATVKRWLAAALGRTKR
jgi:hypothetical protein